MEETQPHRLTEVLRDRLSVHLPRASWNRLGGLDTDSLVWQVGSSVVKATSMLPFQAQTHAVMLRQIHGALAPEGLAPALLFCEYDGERLVSIFEFLVPIADASPRAIGEALGRAHAILVRMPVRSSRPWVGFYGEWPEFSKLVPLMKDRSLQRSASQLLPLTVNRDHTAQSHYIHRDLGLSNTVRTQSAIALIDWDMAHAGYAIDDLAMTISCLGADFLGKVHPCQLASEVLEGYAHANAASRVGLAQPEFISAIALAGLRQAVAGWYSDQGDTTAPYWPNIRKRLSVACELTATLRHTRQHGVLSRK